MHSIKTDIVRKEDATPLNSNASKLIEKRNSLRGLVIVFCFVWLIVLGTILFVKGEQWWAAMLAVVFLSLISVLPLNLKIKGLTKQIDAQRKEL